MIWNLSNKTFGKFWNNTFGNFQNSQRSSKTFTRAKKLAQNWIIRNRSLSVLSTSFDQSEFSCRLKKLRSRTKQLRGKLRIFISKKSIAYFKLFVKAKWVQFLEQRLKYLVKLPQVKIVRQIKVSSISIVKTQISRQITWSQNCSSKQSEFRFYSKD